jgi:hypothetical protein
MFGAVIFAYDSAVAVSLIKCDPVSSGCIFHVTANPVAAENTNLCIFCNTLC